MNHTDAKEHLYIDRYLAGKLSASEQEAFETHILACQECLDELELTERLRSGLRDAFGPGEAGRVQPAAAASVSPFRAAPFATAASLFGAISLLAAGLLYFGQGTTDVPAAAQVFPVHAPRSIDAAPTNLLRLASADVATVMLLDPGPEEYRDYRIQVRHDNAPESLVLPELDGLRPTYEDLLAFTLPSSALAPGDYVIDLFGWSSRDSGYERIQQFRFRVLP